MQVGKKYKIILKNGFTYSGKVEKIEDGLIHFYDKNNELIYFAANFIDLATPLGGWN